MVDPADVILTETETSFKEIGNSIVFFIAHKIRNILIAEVAVRFCPPLTYTMIAEKFGITRERVSQLVTQYYPEHSLRDRKSGQS
jgi:DNA-directed RNA polymerase sigma subunit (sigma70/sigma32)